MLAIWTKNERDYMLKKCLFVGILCCFCKILYCNRYYILKTTESVVQDLKSSRAEMIAFNFYTEINKEMDAWVTKVDMGTRRRTFIGRGCPYGIHPEGLVYHWDCRLIALENSWNSYYQNKSLPRLIKALYDRKNQGNQKLMEEVKQQQILYAKQQSTLLAIQKEQMVQAQRMERIIAGNNQFMSFLVMMELKISSEQEANERLLAAEQLLKADLVDEQNKVLLLNNKLKALKEQLDFLAVENEDLRQKMLSLLSQMQITLKEKILLLM